MEAKHLNGGEYVRINFMLSHRTSVLPRNGEERKLKKKTARTHTNTAHTHVGEECSSGWKIYAICEKVCGLRIYARNLHLSLFLSRSLPLSFFSSPISRPTRVWGWGIANAFVCPAQTLIIIIRYSKIYRYSFVRIVAVGRSGNYTISAVGSCSGGNGSSNNGMIYYFFLLCTELEYASRHMRRCGSKRKPMLRYVCISHSRHISIHPMSSQHAGQHSFADRWHGR